MKPYYSDEWATIYHGDCLEVMPVRADMVLTDPPFSDATHRNAKSNRGSPHARKAIDFKAIDFKAIDSMMRLSGEACEGWFVAFMDWRHIAELERATPAPWEFMRFGVWLKSNPMPQISADRPANGWDGIVYLRHATTRPQWYGGGKHGNWYSPVVNDGLHPTSKPIALLETLVGRFTTHGQTILDPFVGSGTTLVAAKNLGRKSIGIEIEERYCEIAANRLAQEVFQFEEATA